MSSTGQEEQSGASRTEATEQRSEHGSDPRSGQRSDPRQDPRQDPDYPVYQGDTDKSQHTRLYQQFASTRRLIDNVPDQVYFIFAGLASIWLAVTALVEAVHLAWWSVLFVLVFWGIAAYLTLPRINRILTNIYVPSYFFGRTQTSDGILGDPVNLALRGEKDDLQAAFQKAGWTLAEPVTLRSSWRIVVSSLRKSSYPEAPVSPLLLWGRKQDFAFQQEVDGNPSKRHHVRFWKAPDGWKLPGGLAADWMADATYDRGVGVSLFTLQVTHRVDQDTDKERDYVLETIRFANPEARTETIENFQPGYDSRNGGGDEFHTDGDLPILDLNDVVPGDHEEREDSDEEHRRHRTMKQLAAKAPPTVWAAGLLVALVALVNLGRSLDRVLSTDLVQRLLDADYPGAAALLATDTGNDFWTVVTGLATAGLVVVAVVQMGLAVEVIRGRHRPRQIILALLCLSFLVASAQIMTDSADTSNLYEVFVVLASHVFAMIAYTDDDVVNYTYSSAQMRRHGEDPRAGDHGED